MLEELVPIVYDERHNKKCVMWAADSFLLSKNPDVYSFKPNVDGMDVKGRLLAERKEKQTQLLQQLKDANKKNEQDLANLAILFKTKPGLDRYFNKGKVTPDSSKFFEDLDKLFA